MDGGFHTPQAPLAGYRPYTGAPIAHYVLRAAALREAAQETARDLGLTPNHDRGKAAALLREHEGLSLRALAAEHWSRGEEVLARHYLRSARRVEAGR